MAVPGFIILFIVAVFPEYGEAKNLHVYASKTMNWDQALEYCKSMNKELVSITSKEEHNQLANAMHTCGTKCLGHSIEHAWTAGAVPLKDHAGTFRFEWRTTGQAVTPDRFAPDHPPDNYEGDERCLEAFDIPRENQVVLNDYPCSRTQYVVCQSK